MHEKDHWDLSLHASRELYFGPWTRISYGGHGPRTRVRGLRPHRGKGL